jgi:hypothetical protein
VQSIRQIQRDVERSIKLVGGYWSPAAGVLRLLEEIGELADLVSTGDPTQSLDLELADVAIISICTANQFLASLQASPPPSVISVDAHLRALLAAAGQLARTVNYYDGPKKPRSFTEWRQVGSSVQLILSHAEGMSQAVGGDLEGAIGRKLSSTPVRDAGRFTHAYDNPSTSAALDRFLDIRSATPCPFAPKAKLWGVSIWDERLNDSSVCARVPATLQANLTDRMRMFARAADLEGLDALVVMGPSVSPQQRSASLDLTSEWFAEVFRTLRDADSESSEPWDVRLEPGWQLSFEGCRMFVAVFSPEYDLNHPRHSPHHLFAFFQPESSFERWRVGSSFPTSVERKRSIRAAFSESGKGYDASLVDRRIEALLYVLPNGHHMPQWWKSVQDSGA